MNLKEVVEYIPNCVLCEKEMRLYLDSYYSPKIYLNIVDGIANNKKLDIEIDINTNKIIKGAKSLNTNFSNHGLKKNCGTCRFHVSFYANDNIKSTFPDVIRYGEELHYFDQGKEVRIYNKAKSCTVSYGWGNNKSMPFTFDFQSIKFPAIKKKS